MPSRNLSRRHPLDEVRELFRNAPLSDLPTMAENLPLDIFERDGELVVKAALPGVKRDDVKISVTDGVLSIRGTLQEEQEVKEEDYYLREYRAGSFSRSVRLPADIDTEHAEAELEDGTLTLHLPRLRKEGSRSVRIPIA